jgi:hypothetical protein
VDLEMLMGELKADQEIRDKIARITGKRPDDAVNQGEQGGGPDAFGQSNDADYNQGNDFDGGYGEFASAQMTDQVRRELSSLEFKPISNAIMSRRRPLLSREFVFPDGTPMDEVLSVSRSGKKVHAVLNQRSAKRKQHENIARAARALQDPAHYARVKAEMQRSPMFGGKLPFQA